MVSITELSCHFKGLEASKKKKKTHTRTVYIPDCKGKIRLGTGYVYQVGCM